MGSSDTWHKNPGGNDFYYAAFWEGQPDLNFRNYEVREEMKNVVRYWLNKGFDGLRIDAVRYLIETNDSKYDTDETHGWFSELRSEVIDAYKDISPKFMTCEAWITGNRSQLEKYFGTDEKPEFNMVFDFDQGYGVVDSVGYGKSSYLSSSLRKNPAKNKSYGTFIGNHDNYIDRLGTVFGYEAQIKAATALSLLRPIVPFIYYGQEIGMKDNTSYGSGDIRHRTDIDWAEVEKQRANPSSILNLNKAIFALRKTYPNLFADGKVEFLKSCTVDANKNPLNNVVAYIISDGTDSLLCVQSLINFGDYPFWFENSSLVDVSNYSVLIGINDAKNLSIDDGALKIDFIAPYETRVYYLGDTSKEMLFTDNRLFLRGSMNDFGYNEMEYDSENKTFSTSVKLKAGTYQFKFDKYCDWTLSYGSGEENKDGKAVSLGETMQTSVTAGKNTNFSVIIPSAGTYLFTFYEDSNTFKVEKKQ